MNALISACLLGERCRFDGKTKPLPIQILNQLKEKYNLISVCPEQLGGLSTPRKPAEKCGNNFLCQDGTDVTHNYLSGAQKALEIALANKCSIAILKERSPSCGFGKIYDGSFTGTLTKGNGAAAELLHRNGIAIIGESKLD